MESGLPESCPPRDGLAVASFPYLNPRNLRALLTRSSAVHAENLKKFSLNPVEGISTSDLNVHPPSREAMAGKPGLARITMRKRNK